MSDLMSKILEDDATEFQANISDQALAKVSALAKRQLSLVEQIHAAQQAMDILNEQLVSIRDHELPDLMDELGLQEFKLNTGNKVTVKKDWVASISKDREEEALGWLKDQGHEALIKSSVKINVGKDQEVRYQAIMTYLQTLDVPFESKQEVHWQTLRAFIKERVEAGAELPLELFGAFQRKQAKIS